MTIGEVTQRSAHDASLAARLGALAPWLLCALRLVTGYLFLLHGLAKTIGIPHDPAFDGLALASLPGVAGILETVGGALIVAGLFTRVVAFVLSGEMAVAYFLAHASHGHALVPILNQGEAAVLYCFVFLYLSAAGPGRFALDNLRSR